MNANLSVKIGKTYRKSFEAFVKESGYETISNVEIGEKIDGTPMKADLVIHPNRKRRTVIFFRTQTVSGTAENKVPFDAINADHAAGKNDKVYLVLAGKGWGLKKKKFFTTELSKKIGIRVKVVSEADFRTLVVRKAV
jgi:hypothetical protein